MIKMIRSVLCVISLSALNVFGCDGLFEQTLNPVNLLNQIHEYVNEREDYHIDMLETVKRIQSMEYGAKKVQLITEMYGIPDCSPSEISGMLNMACTDHEAWAKWFTDFKGAMQNSFGLDPEEQFFNVGILKSVHKCFYDGLKFYEDDKKKFVKRNFQDIKGTARYNLRSYLAIFLKNHTITVYDDFIADLARISSDLSQILGYVELSIYCNKLTLIEQINDETDKRYFSIFFSDPLLMDPRTRKQSIVWRTIGDNPPILNLLDYVSIVGLYNPMIYSEFAEQLSLYGKVQEPSEEVETPKGESIEIEEKGPDVPLVSEIKDVKEETKATIMPSITEIQVQKETPVASEEPRIETVTDVNNEVNDKVAVIVPVEPKTEKKEEIIKKKNEVPQNSTPQKSKRKVNKRKQKVQRIAAIAQRVPVLEDIVSYDLNNLPLGSLLGKTEFCTLDSILHHERNVKWNSFKHLVTSKHGFNGSILGNKGGSFRRVCFLNPLTGEKVSFLIHKPHKPGKGESGNLYLDLMTRITRKLAKFGLLG